MKHISESIIGRKGVPNAKYWIEFGGLDPKLLRKYAAGEITFTDLSMNLVAEEITYTDPNDNFTEADMLQFAKQVINRQYKFPKMVYARVMDQYKEVIDTIYGRNFQYDLDKYCKK
jgi:hypothetical protein